MIEFYTALDMWASFCLGAICGMLALRLVTFFVVQRPPDHLLPPEMRDMSSEELAAVYSARTLYLLGETVSHRRIREAYTLAAAREVIEGNEVHR